jgi:P4 family phage/plasmid primase-like protien
VSPKFHGDFNTLDLVAVCQVLGLDVRQANGDFKFWLRCPWAEEHSANGRSDTVIWQEPEKWPTFNCSHNHCAGRKLEDVIDWAEALRPGIIDEHCRQTWRRDGLNGHRAAAVLPERKPEIPTPEEAVRNTKELLNGFRVDQNTLWEHSSITLGENWQRDDAEILFERLYDPEEFVCLCTRYETQSKPDGTQKAVPVGAGSTLRVRELRDKIRRIGGVPQDKAGCWYRINPVSQRGSGTNGAHRDKDVAAYRFLLLESDDLPPDLQLSFFLKLELPVVALVSSGGRSIHSIIRLDAPSAEEFKRLADYILGRLARFGIDQKNRNPSRYSRLPGAQRVIGAQTLLGEDSGQQRLLYFNHQPKPFDRETFDKQTEEKPIEQPPNLAKPVKTQDEAPPTTPPLEKDLQGEAKTEKRAWPEVEGETAAALRSKIGELLCVESDWFACKSGVWQPRIRDEFRPFALELLPGQHRTHRNSLQILGRLEGEQQTTRSTFCGAAKFNADGWPLISVKDSTICITPDGILNLATDPDEHFTFALPIDYRPDAEAPLFHRTLREAVPDDADRELFLDVLATALIPDCRHEVALVVVGESGTGKSTIMAPIPFIFGEACSSLSIADLCHPSGFKLALLNNRMINLATELNTVELDDSGLFKQLVSGESFTARPIYGKPFEMRSIAKLVFLANSLPKFRAGTDAEIRRLRFVRFDRKVSNPDLTLKERLANEAAGVFAELVRRARSLLTRRLPDPSNFGRETVERFSVSNDPVGQFVKHECELAREKQCNKDLLYEEFAKFRDAHGISDRFDKSLFFRTLYDRFPSVKQIRSSSNIGRIQVVTGIDLKDDEKSS